MLTLIRSIFFIVDNILLVTGSVFFTALLTPQGEWPGILYRAGWMLSMLFCMSISAFSLCYAVRGKHRGGRIVSIPLATFLFFFGLGASEAVFPMRSISTPLLLAPFILILLLKGNFPLSSRLKVRIAEVITLRFIVTTLSFIAASPFWFGLLGGGLTIPFTLWITLFSLPTYLERTSNLQGQQQQRALQIFSLLPILIFGGASIIGILPPQCSYVLLLAPLQVLLFQKTSLLATHAYLTVTVWSIGSFCLGMSLFCYAVWPLPSSR